MTSSLKTLLILAAGLIIIFAGGTASHMYLARSAGILIESLDALWELVEAEDWERAKEKVQSIEEDWQSTKQVWAAIVNHQEIDQLELIVVRLRQQINNEDKHWARIELSLAKSILEHVYEKERLTWGNIMYVKNSPNRAVFYIHVRIYAA